MRILLIAVAVLVHFRTGFSQEGKLDTLWFMNGEILNAKVTDTTDAENVTCKFMKKKKEKTLKIEKERLFSVKFSDSTEKIYYKYDTLAGNIFTVEETRYFILGEQDAIKGYKPNISLIGGVVVGVASPIITPTILASVPVIAFGAASAKLPKVKVNTEKITNKEYLKVDTYLLGYERVARKKKMFNAFVGGGAGLAVGFGVVIGILREKVL